MPLDVHITIDQKSQDELLDSQMSLLGVVSNALQKALPLDNVQPVTMSVRVGEFSGFHQSLDKVELTEESMIRQAMTRLGQVNNGHPWWPVPCTFAPDATSSLEVSINGLATTFFFAADGSLLHMNQDF